KSNKVIWNKWIPRRSKLFNEHAEIGHESKVIGNKLVIFSTDKSEFPTSMNSEDYKIANNKFDQKFYVQMNVNLANGEVSKIIVSDLFNSKKIVDKFPKVYTNGGKSMFFNYSDKSGNDRRFGFLELK
ncbi:MAG: hypothetical protein K2Q22_09945, partial [Cytophagales bacterium]|nr:hypothetical protein [Cytophagales bacterium]